MPQAFENGLNYNTPDNVASSIDKSSNNKQMNTYFYYKRALIESQKERYFLPLSSTIGLPKHMGKKIKRYNYIPLLDDRNKNDQGIDAKGAVIANGNLYGSSHDIGTITAKLPLVGENGGRVNRVGFTRIVREGSIYRLGFFYEFTEDTLNFDSDAELQSHLARETINGATEMAEDILQKDIIQASQAFLFPGSATSIAQVTAEGATPDILNWDILMRLDRLLTENRTPRQTTVITGSRNVDTRTIPSARIAFVGPELAAHIRKMEDPFGNAAFISVEKYASSTTVLNGEIGSIGYFRFIEVPEMLFFEGSGATVTTNPGYGEANGKYNVYPLVVVGEDAFNTIGFQTTGTELNFKIITKNPGEARADRNDPYGLTGFSSITFWYGFLCNWPERIGIIYSVAPI